MQDKEFDQFFKDKLGETEVKPPAMLWAKVDAQLAPVVPKKRFPMLWMAAAVAVVALSAGLLFNQQEATEVQGQAVAVSKKPIGETAPVSADTEPVVVQAPVTATSESALSPVEKQTVVSKVASAPVKKQVKKEWLAMQPSGQDKHLVISQKEVKQPAHETILIADMEPALAIVTPNEDTMVGVQEIQEQDALANEYNAVPEKKGINNVGDLVNFVVDKIDKREEKFLQFNPNDDDQSSLVSINIGIIKLNTKQKAKR